MKIRFPLVGLAVIASALPAHAQLGPQLFGITHFFGGPNATTVRGYGMGGAGATMPGIDSGNPAQAAFLDTYDASVRYGRTSFASGTRFDSRFVALSIPLSRKDGFKLIYNDVHSPERTSFASAVFPGSTQKFYEESAGFFYGRQVTDKLSLGVGLAPILLTHQRLNNVGSPGVDIHIDGKPLANALNRLGGRFGLDYQFAPWGRASVYYDNYYEQAKMTVPDSLSVLGLATQDADFHEVALNAGLELHPLRHLSLVAEHQRITGASDNFNSLVHNTFVGAEYQVKPWLALRTGRHEGNSTYGFELSRGQFKLQGARVNNLGTDELKPIFGSGNHLNILELGYTF